MTELSREQFDRARDLGNKEVINLNSIRREIGKVAWAENLAGSWLTNLVLALGESEDSYVGVYILQRLSVQYKEIMAEPILAQKFMQRLEVEVRSRGWFEELKVTD